MQILRPQQRQIN